MVDQARVIYDLAIGAIFNELEQPITQISRSRQYSTKKARFTRGGFRIVFDIHLFNVE